MTCPQISRQFELAAVVDFAPFTFDMIGNNYGNVVISC